jgi:hypothetical protein
LILLQYRYAKEFRVSGYVKLVNTIIQFFPSMIITRILKFTNQVSTTNVVTMNPSSLLNHKGLQLSFLLFLTLSMKTAVENQYFDIVTRLGAQVRGTLSAAIYQKAFRLGSSGRQNVTVSVI